MYICEECGKKFFKPFVWEESRGEFWGEPCSEKMSGCPYCNGSYIEETVYKCKVCGEEVSEEKIISGVCTDCIDKYRKNFDACYDLSFGETEQIKINALLASLFEPSDIEAILKEYIKNRWRDVNCSVFIDSDISWFAEKIAEEVKKNENKKN